MIKNQYFIVFFVLTTLFAKAQVGIETTDPKSTLDVQGSLGFKVTTITTPTTLNQTHNIVLCDNGPYMVMIPPANSNTGKVYYIKNIDVDGDDIAIVPFGSEKIEGTTGYTLNAYKQSIRIVCDGSNWHIIEESIPVSFYQTSFNPLDCNGSIFKWIDVTNPQTGKTWMDRNLGASQAAVNSTDANSFGDLYQFGRLKDGHQCRTSSTTTILSNTLFPSHSKFITPSCCSFNWRNESGNLSAPIASAGINPCPDGYRLPTMAEWNAERSSWTQPPISSFNNANGAMASPLRLPLAGQRRAQDGILNSVGSIGFYWSSTYTSFVSILEFSNSTALEGGKQAGFGISVRCIKN